MSVKRTIKRLTIGLLLLILVCGAFVILRPDLWHYYTDGFKIHQPGRDAVLRQVLWEDPELMATHLNSKPDNYEPTISADGRTLIFSRGRAKLNADLYVTHWDGKVWGEPQPLDELNTDGDELGPELSRDGAFLYFYSNREGGLGGYDIWLSGWDGDGWGEAVNLGEKINSAYNDYDPALSPAGRRLYLSSNRPKQELTEKERAAWDATLRESRHLADYDIFVADALVLGEAVEGAAPSTPEFAQSVRVDVLNSLADEGQVAMTPRGDFLYFSSDREGGRGGFDIYRSRIFDGGLLKPENVGAPVNTALDDMDPALWMEGYGLVFSSNRERLGEEERRFRIYHSLTREVMSRTDLSALAWLMEFLRLNKWWVLGLLVALLALIWLLRLFLNKSFREKLTLIQRCILGSVMLHLLIAFLLSLWLVSEAVYQAVTEPSMEIAINEGALARERLALDIREQVTELPESKTTFEAREQLERLPLPELEPVQERLEPEASSVPPPEFATEVETQPAPEPPKQELTVAKVNPQLPALALAVAPFALETPDKVAPEPEPKVTPAKPKMELKTAEPLPELDRPSPSLAATEVEPSQAPSVMALETNIFVVEPTAPALKAIQPSKVNTPTKRFQPIALASVVQMEAPTPVAPEAASPGVEPVEEDSAATLTKVSPAITPSNRPMRADPSVAPITKPTPYQLKVKPLAVAAALPKLSEIPKPGQMLGKRIPDLEFRPNLTMETPAPLNTPYILRHPETRKRLIETLGGSDQTEAAIKRSLDWLTRNQAADGSWEVGKFGGRNGHRTAGTGLALLCYLGWGAKHTEAGPYQEPIRRAVNFLVQEMKDDGKLWSHGDRGMYDQGIAAIALAEAYGVSRDPTLKEPVELALQFIIRASRKGNEWRYNPGDAGDTSVYGWQVMALKSGQLAGIKLPDGTLERAGDWLDKVGGGQHGGIYGYTSKAYHGAAMVAEGMFCQQLLGVHRSDPRMIESASHMAERLPDPRKVDFYYFYYGCLALYQHQGPIWEDWNLRMRELLLSIQSREGADDGSWGARGARPKDYGRLVSTTMATLSLEVYYRYLPLYGLERN